HARCQGHLALLSRLCGHANRCASLSPRGSLRTRSAMIDGAAVLAAFDEQVRRRGEPDTPEERVERDEHVLRRVGPGRWLGVEWCSLDERSADAAIDAQIERFGELDCEWEWKHYSYDTPADLPERLLAHGFRAEE